MTRHERFDQQAEDISRQIEDLRENGADFAKYGVVAWDFQETVKRINEYAHIADAAINRIRDTGDEIEAAWRRRTMVPDESAAPPAHSEPTHAGEAMNSSVGPAVRTRTESSEIASCSPAAGVEEPATETPPSMWPVAGSEPTAKDAA